MSDLGLGLGDPTRCWFSDCKLAPVWQVGFVLWAPGRRGAPATAATGIRVCSKCRAKIRLGDLLGDEAWTQLCAMFTLAGKVRPARDLVELTFARTGGTVH